MDTEVGAVVERRVTKGGCSHHWLIEPPNGPRSRGVCKHCGAVKVFDNILEDLLSNIDSSIPLESADLLETEDLVNSDD